MKKTLTAPATDLLALCRSHGVKIVTAESCTGGLISAALTEIAGSSDVFERGFVTYSNEAKSDMLGVSAELINSDGAVSERVARAMAEGALKNSNAHIAVAVTGVAGPGGGTDEKPVGLVHIAVAKSGGTTQHQRCQFKSKSRNKIRTKTVRRAFKMIDEMLNEPVLA